MAMASKMASAAKSLACIVRRQDAGKEKQVLQKARSTINDA